MTTIATAALAYATREAGSEARTASRYGIEIIADLAAAEAPWRAFEGEAVTTPYGRFDWVRAFAADGPPPRVALVRDTAGKPALLLALAVERRLGLTVAAAIGGKHANYNLPLVRPDVMAALSGHEARRLLCRIGRALGADVVAAPNVPLAWQGQPNPFAEGGSPSPSDAWSLRLGPDGEATLAGSMSPEARKKLRNKSRGLAKLGEVTLLQAATEGEVDLILDAFWAQKEERFRSLGIADPFAENGTRAAIRRAALEGLPEGTPAIELHGLTVAGRIVAVFGGAADSRRLSGMFVSFDPGEASKFSPGEILATGIIRAQCARGRVVFDLGVGEARYKRSICDTVEPLVDLAIPVTLRGRLYVAAHGLAIDAKRRIKANPRAMALVAGVRKAMAQRRPGR